MVLKARVEGLRDLGMCQNPFGSFLLLQFEFQLRVVKLYRAERAINGILFGQPLQGVQIDSDGAVGLST
eukprot:5020598-Pyramimonas_sp.AAC.1